MDGIGEREGERNRQISISDQHTTIMHHQSRKKERNWRDTIHIEYHCNAYGSLSHNVMLMFSPHLEPNHK